jgi:integrase
VPEPYNRTQLRELQSTLDERWSKLPPDEADRWLCRVKERRSPYARVRVHAIRCQLDAIVVLALHQGLRRSEIWRANLHDLHYDNMGVVVRDKSGGLDGDVREVPYTDAAREAIEEWIVCRHFLGPEHLRPWLNLHAEPTKSAPLTRHTFDKLLRTYLGPRWTLKRLRDTSAAGWVRSGLPLEHLRQLLGLSRIEDVLPYARLVRGSLEGEMAKRDALFTELVQPVSVAA